MNWRGNSFAFDGTGTGIDDNGGHSHAVSGLIGARPDNGTGLIGIAHEALVVPYKCLEGGSGTWEWFANCVRQFADSEFPGHEGKIKILNASLGGSAAPPFVRDALEYAVNKSVIIVASAGNPGQSNPVKYPGAYEDLVITIGAVDESDIPAYFTASGPEVDLTNYGVKVYTHNNKNGYSYVSGTSFSSPLTAGIIALVVSHHYEFFSQFKGKELRDKVEKFLEKLADDVHTRGFDHLSGYGVPRLKKLIEANPEDVLNSPDDPRVPRPNLRTPLNGVTENNLSVIYRWYEVLLATYKLEIARDFEFNDIVLSLDLEQSSINFAVPDYGTYYWRVKAIRNGEESEWSSRWKVTFEKAPEIIPAPEQITPDDKATLDEKRVTFEWGEIEGATKYRLRVSSDPNFSSAFGYIGTSTKKMLTIPEMDETYYWKVRAEKGSDLGQWSEVREFIVSEKEDPSFPDRNHNILLEGPYTIIYAKNGSSNNGAEETIAEKNGVKLITARPTQENHQLVIKNIKVKGNTTLSFDEIHDSLSTKIRGFFLNRGLLLENPDAKSAHDATIYFLNLFIKENISTFELISIESDSKNRIQF